MFSRIACCSHNVAKNHSALISRKSKTLQASSEHKMRHIESHLKQEGISVSRIAIARSAVGSGGGGIAGRGLGRAGWRGQS